MPGRVCLLTDPTGTPLNFAFEQLAAFQLQADAHAEKSNARFGSRS